VWDKSKLKTLKVLDYIPSVQEGHRVKVNKGTSQFSKDCNVSTSKKKNIST
jgi:hypothetical protein